MKIIKLSILFCFSLILLNSCSSSKHNIHNNDEIYGEINANRRNNNENINGNKLHKEIKKWLGVPYRYGGHSKNGTDCSGLVMEIYKKVYNKKLERNSAAIMKKNCRRINRKDLKEGDLVFFSTGKSKNRINHVGIYLKDSKFVHASSSKGVIISSLKEKYYIRTYNCSGRVKF